MHRYLVKGAFLAAVLLSTGCQTNPRPAGSATNDVFSTITPPPAELSLAQNVQMALAKSGDPALSQISVQANQSTVILVGYVKKIRQSDSAEQIARQVPGVTSVSNRIIIKQ
jgi:hyperosmotically inducible protein